MDDKAQEKKDRLLAALDKGMVMIHLDPRRPGVSVPPACRTEPHVRLNLSYRFDPPDLTVNEWGIRSTLSFSGSRFACAVPWSALFAIVSHVTQEFWMFPDDMPAELLQSQVPKATQPQVSPPARPVLRSVLRAAEALDPSEPGSDPAPSPEAPPSAPNEAAGKAAIQARDSARDDAPEASPALPASSSSAGAKPDDVPPPKGRGHLRVVK